MRIFKLHQTIDPKASEATVAKQKEYEKVGAPKDGDGEKVARKAVKKEEKNKVEKKEDGDTVREDEAGISLESESED